MAEEHTHPTPTWTVIVPRDVNNRLVNQKVDASQAGMRDDTGHAHEIAKTAGVTGADLETDEIATGTGETESRVRGGRGTGKGVGVGVQTDRISVEVSNLHCLRHPRSRETHFANNRTPTEDGQVSRPITVPRKK